ncbi:MAG: YqiJ family protein [Sphingomonadales bacterium]
MLELFFAQENVAFTAALALMIVIGLVEALGLGAGLSADIDLDADVDVDADVSAAGSVLQWLNVGRLPFLAFLVVALTSFGMIGLIGQRILFGATGMMLPAMVAVPAAFFAGLPVTRILSAGLARILPKDETTAVGLDTLIGRMATIVLGSASNGNPAQAKVRDQHGQTHYVMVEPDRTAVTFDQSETVLLVRRSGSTFFAIRAESDALSAG